MKLPMKSWREISFLVFEIIGIYMKSLLDKVAIVTGAAHPMGMGFAAALKLAQAGAKVILTDLGRNEQELETLEQRANEIRELDGNAIAMAVDITQRSQIDRCVENVIEQYGKINILFNNAGSPIGCGEFLNMSDQQWDISYQVNGSNEWRIKI